MKTINIKRVYDEYSEKDGYRILVDRVWPRGVSKERAKLDEWNKDIAPSTELRKWFDHKEERFAEFKKRYDEELSVHKETLTRIIEISKKKNVCLVYSAKNQTYNQAVVLQRLLNSLL